MIKVKNCKVLRNNKILTSIISFNKRSFLFKLINFNIRNDTESANNSSSSRTSSASLNENYLSKAIAMHSFKPTDDRFFFKHKNLIFVSNI
jgi:hypothetical protein